MINANHKHLKHSAKTKKDAAAALVKTKNKHSIPALYLSHVTLECAFKLRILRQNNANHINDLSKRMPKKAFESLFHGSTGHDLHHLAIAASIKRFLEANGNGHLLNQPEWQAMAGERPYSIRYGTESVDFINAKRQVDFAIQLTDLILNGTL